MKTAVAEFDWVVTLTADDPRIPEGYGGGWLEIMDGSWEPDDAVEALDGWAETIRTMGFVPESGQWANKSPAQLVRRLGKNAWTVRIDSFEFETDTGYSNGYGTLRLEKRPR